jgi:hypothetical protein
MMDKNLEATLKRRASGELRIDVKGMLRRSVSSVPPSGTRSVPEAGESFLAMNARKESTVYVDPTDEDIIATMMGWEEEG